ncbi:MAG: hypothetical protein M3N54_12835 [Acidobacteriota bacterium]|nr:hypothetical protein [Acidobacteriota bacterium]
MEDTLAQTLAYRALVADELGALEHELAPLAAKVDRALALRTQIRSWFEAQAADEGYLVNGKHYAVAVGEKSNETHITSKPKLEQLLGRARYRELAHFTLKSLAFLSPLELSTISAKTRTGSRSIKVLAKAAGVAQ